MSSGYPKDISATTESLRTSCADPCCGLKVLQLDSIFGLPFSVISLHIFFQARFRYSFPSPLSEVYGVSIIGSYLLFLNSKRAMTIAYIIWESLELPWLLRKFLTSGTGVLRDSLWFGKGAFIISPSGIIHIHTYIYFILIYTSAHVHIT